MIATHHIKANKDDIAKTVLMMGDPLRAKDYAEKHLKNAKLICDIRGINIWTGEYNNQKVTIMGHGMGMSSIAIYAHELFEFFDVDRIIRLGSSASYKPDLKQGDIVVGDKYYTYSLIGEGYGVNPEEPVFATKSLINLFEQELINNNARYQTGGIYSSLWFYAPSFTGEGIKQGTMVDKAVKSGDIIAKEMESYILQVIANHFKKEAITVVTIIDNLATKEFSSALNKVDTSLMGEIALKALFK